MPITGCWNSFIGRTAHLDVPKGLATADGPVHKWLDLQRYLASKGRLREDRFRKLMALGFMPPVPVTFPNGMRQLKQFQEQNGNAQVPLTYTSANGFPLGQWVADQLRDMDRLTSHHQRNALLRAGVGVPELRQPGSSKPVMANTSDRAWAESLIEAHAYFKENGHFNPPADFVTSSGFALASWLRSQKKLNTKGTLRPDRKASLEGIGFVFTKRPGWEGRLDQVTALIEQDGEAVFARGYKAPDGFWAGNWISAQRTAARSGELSDDRVALLVARGIVKPLVHEISRWDDGLRAYENHVREGGGRVTLSTVTVDNFPLGRWLKTIKAANAKGKLGEDKMAKLAALGVALQVPHKDR